MDVPHMAKLGPTGYLSIFVALLGVLFYVGAVSGWFFGGATAPTDIGLLAVTVVFLALGLLGVWAHFAERKQHGE